MTVTNRPSSKSTKIYTPTLCVLDVETTGLFPNLHGIIQVSGTILQEGKDAANFDLFCRPQEGVEVPEKTLNWHGLTLEELESYPSPSDTLNQLKNVFAEYVDPYNKHDKMHLVGYNARFDADFLRAFFEREGDKFFGSWFWHPPIDVMNMAALYLLPERQKLRDFKLGTVANYLGIEVDAERLHDSLYDVSLTLDIYRRLTERQEHERAA